MNILSIDVEYRFEKSFSITIFGASFSIGFGDVGFMWNYSYGYCRGGGYKNLTRFPLLWKFYFEFVREYE